MAMFGVVSKKGLQPKTHCITLDDVLSADKQIRPFGIGPTPVMTSHIMNELSGHDLYFKCELLQKTGSFKVMKAINVCK
jgi:threonine dehydratase